MFWAAARPWAQARGIVCAKRAPRAMAMLWARPALRRVALVLTFFKPVVTRWALTRAVIALSSAGETATGHEDPAVAPDAPEKADGEACEAGAESRSLGPRIGRTSRLLAGTSSRMLAGRPSGDGEDPTTAVRGPTSLLALFSQTGTDKWSFSDIYGPQASPEDLAARPARRERQRLGAARHRADQLLLAQGVQQLGEPSAGRVRGPRPARRRAPGAASGRGQPGRSARPSSPVRGRWRATDTSLVRGPRVASRSATEQHDDLDLGGRRGAQVAVDLPQREASGGPGTPAADAGAPAAPPAPAGAWTPAGGA